jgi:hypothetical protein
MFQITYPKERFCLNICKGLLPQQLIGIVCVLIQVGVLIIIFLQMRENKLMGK